MADIIHLSRIETKKLLTGKTFFIAAVLFLIAMGSTFITLSLSPEFTDSLGSQYGMEPPSVEDEIISELVYDVLATLKSFSGDLEFSFTQSVYLTSSGLYVVILIFGTVHVMADFSNGTVKNTLLCGYSRRQYYTAKFISTYLAGILFLLATMAMLITIDIIVVQSQLTASIWVIYLKILMAQLVILAEHTAIYIAFAFLFRNGWAFVGSVAALMILPAVFLISAFASGSDSSLGYSLVPTYLSLSGVGNFRTLDQMAALPQAWSLPFLLAAAAAAFAIILSFTWFGQRTFSRKNL